METYLLDWVNLLVRWLHVITGIAWIGASFYFVMLDNSLREPVKSDDKERGVTGELWAVHGGGVYQSQSFCSVRKASHFPIICTGRNGRLILPGYPAWGCWPLFTGWVLRLI